MGIAAYNRGSAAIRASIDADYPCKEPHSLEGSAVHPPAHAPVHETVPRRFEVGDTVYCKVRGVFGYGWPEIVTEVKRGQSFNADRIKTRNTRSWCPAYNFQPNSPISSG